MAITLNPSSITLPNITVYEVIQDGTIIGYRLIANDGYVMYDTTANDTGALIDPETGDFVIDPETGDIVEVPVTYYYREVTYPVRVPIENWSWVAVLESTVDENYIFGGGDEDHEIA